jgi:hypothetical protein
MKTSQVIETHRTACDPITGPALEPFMSPHW